MNKKIISYIFLLVILMACNNNLTEDKVEATYIIDLKDNVVIYKNDIIEYHTDSFIINKSESGSSEKSISFEIDDVTSFNTDQIGISNIELLIDGVVVKKSINIEENNFEYNVSNSGDEISISKYNSKDESVIVPKSIVGIPVTAIEWPGFYNNKDIKNVYLPEGLISIDEGVFESSTLESIILPNSLTTLKTGVFAGSKVNSVTIGTSLKTIPVGAFDGCEIENLVIPDNIIEIDRNAFANNKLVNINWGIGVESIAYGAFAQNELTTLEFPDNISFIGDEAFKSNSFEKIIITNSQETIGDGAFHLDHSDVEVIIPDHINTPEELERIFIREPLTINSVSKAVIFNNDDITFFISWCNELLLNYESTIVYHSNFATEYILEFTVFTEDFDTYSYSITMVDNLYYLTTKVNDEAESITSSESLSNLLK